MTPTPAHVEEATKLLYSGPLHGGTHETVINNIAHALAERDEGLRVITAAAQAVVNAPDNRGGSWVGLLQAALAHPAVARVRGTA